MTAIDKKKNQKLRHYTMITLVIRQEIPKHGTGNK